MPKHTTPSTAPAWAIVNAEICALLPSESEVVNFWDALIKEFIAANPRPDWMQIELDWNQCGTDARGGDDAAYQVRLDHGNNFPSYRQAKALAYEHAHAKFHKEHMHKAQAALKPIAERIAAVFTAHKAEHVNAATALRAKFGFRGVIQDDVVALCDRVIASANYAVRHVPEDTTPRLSDFLDLVQLNP